MGVTDRGGKDRLGDGPAGPARLAEAEAARWKALGADSDAGARVASRPWPASTSLSLLTFPTPHTYRSPSLCILLYLLCLTGSILSA